MSHGGMGHHGGHSGVTHHADAGGMGHHGISLGSILGLNGHHGILGGLFGGHGQHHHHLLHGGEPQDAPGWNMAMQVEKQSVVSRLLNANIGPAILLAVLMGSMIFWLWLVDVLHQHEMEKRSRRQADQQFQSLSLTQQRNEQAAQTPAPQPADSSFLGSTPTPSQPSESSFGGSSPMPSPAAQFASPAGAGQYPGQTYGTQPAVVQSAAQAYGYPEYAAPAERQYRGYQSTTGFSTPSPAAPAMPYGAPLAAPAYSPYAQDVRSAPAAYGVAVQTPAGTRMRVTVNR